VAHAEQDPHEAVAIDAARAAGALLRQHHGQPQQVDYKRGVELVTALDGQAEALIVERIRAAFPEHAILAEEGTAGGSSAEHRWLVDPLDGTVNFAHGYPAFAVSIAYERAGRVLVGVVYDPLRDELFVARAGVGAHLNGSPLRVSTTRELERSLLATGLPYDRPDQAASLRLAAAVLRSVPDLRRSGSAALDLCYVAAGRCDGYWERPLQPWDMAAGALLVAEAGGRVTTLGGDPHDLNRREAVATNGWIHAALLAALAEGGG
jgi:myo-inositol-1(or 4)-monophosphatase